MLLTHSLPEVSPPSAVAVGVFDGVHLGHRHIVEHLIALAAQKELVPTVLTFEPHPLQTLRPDEDLKVLTELQEKAALLKDLGVLRIVVVEFNQEFASQTHAEFCSEVLAGALNAKVVVAGFDFRFGRERGGSAETLKVAGAKLGFEVAALSPFSLPGASEPVSSSGIRRELAGNGVVQAARMLGRPYSVTGEVVMGDQRGRKIGFPTANIPVARNLAWPADGVYAGRFTDEDRMRYDCAINIGRRPTFYRNAEHSTLEAHLLDFDDDLYGHYVKVEFCEFLRHEKRFSGIEALAAQLRVDVAKARAVLSG